MTAIQIENLSSFGQMAVKLDTAFTELVRLSGQIQRLDLDSESGLDKALKLLEQFGKNGIEISDGIKDFAKHLQDVHDKSDAAARQVAERAQLIGQKKQHQNEIVKKLKSLEDNVRIANADISKFRNETNGAGNQNLSIREKLEKLNMDLKGFLTEAQSIKEAASQSNFKTIERDAQSLLDALKNSTKKIDKAISG